MEKQKSEPKSRKTKMIVGIISYVVEVIAIILITLTLMKKIENEKLIFYIVWVMGLSMSALSGIRDSTEAAPTPDVLFGKAIFWTLTAIGVLLGILLIVSFFPQISDYRLLIIIMGVILLCKWMVVHGFKIYTLIAS